MSMKNSILAYLSALPNGATDGEIYRALGIKHYSQVNSRCRQLAAEGLVDRRQLPGGIRNYYVGVSTAKSPTPVIPNRAWYWEGNIQAKVVRHLVLNDHEILRVADTSSREHGRDVVGRLGDREVWVSVKGRPTGTEKTQAATQARSWFHNAFFEMAAWRDEDPKVQLYLALPDFSTYRALAKRIEGAKVHLGYSMLWVHEDGSVELE